MDLVRLADAATRLGALHVPGRPLVLPNAWDAASARAVVAAGFPVVATSSGAVASMLGFDDDDSMPPDEAFSAIARVARAVEVPVTADIEAGYGLGGEEIAERLLGAGAVGCNLEDSDHHGSRALVDPGEHAERIAAVVAAARDLGVDVVVNARTDVFLHARRAGEPVTSAHVREAIERCRTYANAGAACVFPIVARDEGAIAEIVQGVPAPVNVLLVEGVPPLPRLAGIGVARVSLGSGLQRAALSEVERQLATLAAEAQPSSRE